MASSGVLVGNAKHLSLYLLLMPFKYTENQPSLLILVKFIQMLFPKNVSVMGCG